MSAATPLFSPTLDSVQQSFDHWRATRGKRTRTPMDLQRRAAALCDTYPDSHICRALKINDTALKRWRREAYPDLPLTPKPRSEFIELPAEPMVANKTNSSATAAASISIELGDSVRLCVHGNFTLEQVFTAACQVESGACT